MSNPWSVVIPSDEPENLSKCLDTLTRAHPSLDPGNVIVVTSEIRDYPNGMEVNLIHDPSPFNFSRRVNIGVSAAGDRDIFLMGDDVEILATSAIDQISEKASFQIVAPVVRGRAGPRWQREGSPAANVPYVAFIAAYFPRELLEIVGPLWEGFAGYGYEDLDYCIRTNQKGLSCAVTDVLVAHSQRIPSTFLKRHGAEIGDMERASKRAFMKKHSWCSFPATGSVGALDI